MGTKRIDREKPYTGMQQHADLLYSCLKIFNYLLASTVGCGMGKAYPWETNIKFNSSTVSLLVSIFGTLIASYPNDEIQKFLQYVIPRCTAYY